MRVEVYDGVSGFDALRLEWDALLQGSATDVLFLTWGWQRAWWNAFGENKNLHLLAIRDESGQLNAIIPLFVQETLLDPNASLPDIHIENPLVVAGAESRRTVHLVGGSEVSDYLDIIAPAEFNHQAWSVLLDFLTERNDWQILDLRSLPSASLTVAAVTELARVRGWDVHKVREDVCPVLELPGTWEDYLAKKLNKKQRHELRRKMRRAEGETDLSWSWVGAQNLDEGLQIFFELHRASDPNKDSFMSERMEGFFRTVAEAALEKGWLRLSVLRCNGQPVASYLCFDYRTDRLIYNSGFDLSTYGHLSPGIVLLGFLIDDAIRRGCKRSDFLQGGERYKYDLGATDTEVLRLLIRR
jgi:CelD/BcsL family acetyltransferase involved in cellulose biosynthesis